MKRIFAVVIIFILIIVGLMVFVIFGEKNGKVACTQEAKICPDGTAVGRVGPNCEFTHCPIVRAQGVLEGQMTIGPICPVERLDNPCKPTPEMFAARKIFVYTSDQKAFVTMIAPDIEGRFSVVLSEGDYYIDMEHQPIGAISGLPANIIIKENTTTTLNIDIDTGIR